MLATSVRSLHAGGFPHGYLNYRIGVGSSVADGLYIKFRGRGGLKLASLVVRIVNGSADGADNVALATGRIVKVSPLVQRPVSVVQPEGEKTSHAIELGIDVQAIRKVLRSHQR